LEKRIGESRCRACGGNPPDNLRRGKSCGSLPTAITREKGEKSHHCWGLSQIWGWVKKRNEEPHPNGEKLQRQTKNFKATQKRRGKTLKRDSICAEETGEGEKEKGTV